LVAEKRLERKKESRYLSSFLFLIFCVGFSRDQKSWFGQVLCQTSFAGYLLLHLKGFLESVNGFRLVTGKKILMSFESCVKFVNLDKKSDFF
jgi:hypothetical protein